MQQPKKPTSHWSPPWIALASTLGVVALVLAVQTKVAPLPVWSLPAFAVIAAVGSVPVVLVIGGLPRTCAHRVVTILCAGGWSTWAVVSGWTQMVWVAFVGGAGLLFALSYVCRAPQALARTNPIEQDGTDRRPKDVRSWEWTLRAITKQPVVVTDIKSWENPDDGISIHVDLPEDTGMTWEHLHAARGAIQTARKLPNGCVVRVLDGEHQGNAVLDVMLRDCLSQSYLLKEDYSPASVYDTFQVMTTPRGESLDVCLRSQSMVIGGAPESGKTTLLHRIILHLARCTDALVWVMDTNGGGVATPLIRPWAMGLATHPLVDWVAADEAEGAVLIATAIAIMKDRKTSPEATRRRHKADNTTLPVDAQLPAIVVLNDEGGELRQAASLLGQLADNGISRLAQIGRAEGGRVIKSVLRGVADTLDKSMRVNAALRICLRMEEDGEYVHILDQNPGKTRLLHKGTGYLRRPQDPSPILARTVDVKLSQIERAAIACAPLRPELDQRGQRVAARVRVIDVLDGREPPPEIAALPVMRDVELGLAYANRWERMADRLAAMRGEEPAELEEEEVAPPPAPRQAGPVLGSALSALATAAGVTPAHAAQPKKPTAAVDVDDDEAVDREARRLLADVDWSPAPAKHDDGGTDTAVKVAPRMTAREHILAVLTEAYPEALTSAQIGRALDERDATIDRTYRHELLKALILSGQVVKAPAGGYSVPERP